MLRTTTLALVSIASCLGVLPTSAAADVSVRPHDPAAADRPRSSEAPSLGMRSDGPSHMLIVPFFEAKVGTTTGTTTLFAVRNTSIDSVTVDIDFRSPLGDSYLVESRMLGAAETTSVNVRDVVGLPTFPDGFARGHVVLSLADLAADPILTGDFIQVDVDENLATGDRMLTLSDFCVESEIRFLDVGEETLLSLLISSPQGGDPLTDPPSFTVTVIGEDGLVTDVVDVFTDQVQLEIPASLLTDESFGTFLFDFVASNGGWVYARYGAQNRFSVGMNGSCNTE